jgi:CheY-like chemotaxis protein
VTHTVLIVDDHPTFRDAARSLLEAEGYLVIGEAADGQEALRQVEALRPDLVLLDIQLPDIDGFEVAARLGESSSSIVLISSRDRSTYASRLEAAPQLPFLPKRELSGARLDAFLR